MGVVVFIAVSFSWLGFLQEVHITVCVSLTPQDVSEGLWVL